MAADNIEKLAEGLNGQIEKETMKFLTEAMGKRGIRNYDPKKMKRKLFPEDPEALCSYEYEGQPILCVRIINSGIVFDMPN